MKEILQFCFVGSFTFLIDCGLLYVLTEYTLLGYFLSAAVAFSIAVVINYILCLKYVFVSALNGKKQFFYFVMTSIVGLGLNQICMWMFVELLSFYYLIAKVGSTIIVTLWNYVTKKLVLTKDVFRVECIGKNVKRL